MFKKLRDKLILLNLGVTTGVIVVSFAAVFLVFSRTAEERGPKMPNFQLEIEENGSAVNYSGEFEDAIMQSVREERQKARQTLLVSLIGAGVVIEAVVAIVSYFLAEEAIKPVKEAYMAQKVFIANASHEIKTPLAAISANLEAADIRDNRWITNVERETEKLAKLNGELLLLARSDLVQERQTEETDVARLVREAIESQAPRLLKRKLTEDIAPSMKVKINKGDYEQIFGILLDNAIKYSKRKVTVRLNAHELVVENDGARIAAEAI